MKNTGIVRRIDSLGRIVIPKEIRKTLRMRESDMLEIYIGQEKEIIFKKYSPIVAIAPFAENCAKLLSKEISMPVLISGREKVIAVAGAPKRNFLGEKISKELETLIENRKNFCLQQTPTKSLSPIENSSQEAEIALPIIANGDVEGSLIVLKSSNSDQNLSNALKLATFSVKFLNSNIEN